MQIWDILGGLKKLMTPLAGTDKCKESINSIIRQLMLSDRYLGTGWGCKTMITDSIKRHPEHFRTGLH